MKLQWPPFTPSMMVLTAIFAILWLGSILAGVREPVIEWLGLTSTGVVEHFRVWTIFTHAFVQLDFLGIIFAVIAVWLFGGELEARWGTRRFLGIIALAIVVGGTFAFVAQLIVSGAPPMLGFHAAILALITAYCRRNWSRELYFLFFPMTGKTMFLFFAGLSLALGFFAHWVVVPADIGGILVGWFADRGVSIRDLKTRWRMWRARRKLKVVPTPEDKASGKTNGVDRRYMN